MTGYFIPGVPVPQGSKTAFVQGKRAVVTDSNQSVLRPWRKQITAATVTAWSGLPALDGPVKVEALFVLPRKPSVTRDLPTGSRDGDVDKLLRALLDGVTDARVVWVDDSRVALAFAGKVFGDVTGVHVDIAPVTAGMLGRWGARVELFNTEGETA